MGFLFTQFMYNHYWFLEKVFAIYVIGCFRQYLRAIEGEFVVQKKNFIPNIIPIVAYSAEHPMSCISQSG